MGPRRLKSTARERPGAQGQCTHSLPEYLSTPTHHHNNNQHPTPTHSEPPPTYYRYTTPVDISGVDHTARSTVSGHAGGMEAKRR